MKPIRARYLLPSLLIIAVACAVHAQEKPKPTQYADVPMRDGTQLAADVYLPKGEGPWPVILLRSTYSRNVGNMNDFLREGYAAVVQDVRGMGMSPGEKHVFYADGWREGLMDGADTTAWMLEQPWCNGRIGTFGGSALGITQMLLAPVAKGVVAQYIDVAPANFYTEGIYIGGVLSKNLIEGWLTAIGQPHLIALWKEHCYFDDYWKHFDVGAKVADIQAPAIFVGGWYDIFQQGTINAFVAREQHGGDGARGKNMLIMKWSPHGPDVTEDLKLNENRFDLKVSEVRKAFFEARLKGNEDALKPYAKVHYYVMGADTEGAPGNEWRTADAWPPFPSAETAYYLHADGALSTTAPDATAASLGFTFDPKDPYPTHGGANLLLPSGPFDQRKHSATRTDLLKFATEPLDAPMEITGRITVKLYVSSDAPDTDFTAKLLDIYPEGDDREILMLDTIQRVKLRKSFEQPEPLLTGPEEIVELTIDLWSISWIFNTGHRIGLHISSSNFPRFEVNPNTGHDNPEQAGDAMRPANNRIHMDAARPSALLLPVRPATP